MGPEYVNDLPVTTIAEDKVVFPVAGGAGQVLNEPSPVPPWQRWNDYGIGTATFSELGAAPHTPAP